VTPGSLTPGSARRFRWTVRLRLTLLYGALFVLSGAALLGITYALVEASGDLKILTRSGPGSGIPFSAPLPLVPTGQPAKLANERHAAMMHTLLTQAGIALALMSAVSIALGWLMAGRALRPVRVMSDKARRISERNLHERLAVSGPDDELKDLGDTIDGLLSRLDTAFDAQKRFVANASHELRTPLTYQRALIEVALADPDADAEELRAVCRRVLAAGERQESLIAALLTLAHSGRGLERREPVDLALVAGEAVRALADGAVRVERALEPAWTSGDPRLVERLVTNLAGNALRHNVPGGWLRVTTGVVGGRPVLRVVNSGPVIPADRIFGLFQPFQRFAARTGSPEGHGLGLSIVAAVAAVHDARLTAAPGPEGGLDVAVVFGAAVVGPPAGLPPLPSRGSHPGPPPARPPGPPPVPPPGPPGAELAATRRSD
jgi:signal transduction histidine kinase